LTYTPPVAEQRFLLDHVVKIDELSEQVTPDLVGAILEGAGQFAAGEFAPLNRVGDEVGSRWSPEGVTTPPGFKDAYRAYVEGGWGTLTGPPEFGGQGLPLTLGAVVMEDLGSANMGFSLIMMLTPAAVEALKWHGTGEQRQRWMPKLVTGEWNGTMNLTEPQAGSDVGALKTRAVPRGDGSYSIKGQKIFITYGEHDLADNIVHLVLARTPDAPEGTRGISLFLVPKFRLNADGTPGERNDVRCVSIAERATQAAAAYARERVQSAKAGSASRASVPIIEHADVRRMLMRMKALTQAARALAYYAWGQTDRAHLGDEEARARADLLTPLVKAYGTDVGVEVASLGVQVHGGMGYIEETGAAQHYRDARIAPIYEGTNGIQAADLVGRKLGLEGGVVLARLLADIRAGGEGHAALLALVDVCERVAARLASASVDDRMAASYPFLTMLSVATAGWLMAVQLDAAGEAGEESDFLKMKRAACRFYLEQVVPEAAGLEAAATAPADVLYEVTADII
jgi:alkylation response protein AidB-like acyl-CoA dehydrogenase